MTDREKLIELLVEAENGTTVLSGLSKEQQISQIMEQIADRLIANGVVISKNETTTQRWIPVTERLPEDSGMYIVTANDGHAHRVTFVIWQKRNKIWNLTGARSYWRVTHWMPLPEPPEEE